MREERSIDSAIRKALLRQTGGAASSCPDENALAAYLERNLSDQERLRLESHLADCASCRELLALSMRMAADEPAAVADAARSPREWKLLSPSRVPFAIAASLVLAIVTVVVFLLTSEFRKPERVEVAEQRAPAATPAVGNMAAQSRGTSTRQPEPAGPATPGPGRAQTAKGRSDSGYVDTAAKKESRAQEKPSPLAHRGALELKRKVSDTDVIASNEAAPAPAQLKDGSEAAAAASRPAGETAGALVGGVVAGVPAPAKPTEEREAEGARQQAAVVSVGSSDTRGEALNEPARLTLKSRHAVPASASMRAEESMLHDVLQRAAADEKAGNAVRLATRVIGDRTFKLFGDSWIDLKVLDRPDADLVECPPGSPELEEIIKALPEIGRLRQNGHPVLLDCKGRICVIR